MGPWSPAPSSFPTQLLPPQLWEEKAVLGAGACSRWHPSRSHTAQEVPAGGLVPTHVNHGPQLSARAHGSGFSCCLMKH